MADPVITEVDHRQDSWHPITREFAQKTHGATPSPTSIETVDQIMTNVIQKTADAEYSVDSRGCLSFEATLRSGLFIMCEVTTAGNINAGLYHGPNGCLEDFMCRPTSKQLLALF